jgi:hypothetical protein
MELGRSWRGRGRLVKTANVDQRQGVGLSGLGYGKNGTSLGMSKREEGLKRPKTPLGRTLRSVLFQGLRSFLLDKTLNYF